MNKKAITRRAFAGFIAGGAVSSLAACNSDIMQAILNPNSVLDGTGQDQDGQGEAQGQSGSSSSNTVLLEETPHNPTLTGDIKKIIIGVWCVDTAIGTGDRAGQTYDHGGVLNQGYNDGTVLHFSFKDDGTFYMYNFKNKKYPGKWTVKENSVVECAYEDDDAGTMTFDAQDQYLKLDDSKNSVIFNFKKLTDNSEDTSQIAYIDNQVVNFAATIPGTYSLVGLHYADGSKDDLTSEQINAMNKNTGAGYAFSAHKDGNAAMFYPDGSVIPIQIVSEEPSQDGLTYPILAMGIDPKQEISQSVLYTTTDNKKVISIDVPSYTLTFAHVSHREDDWAKYEYVPKAQFPWQPDGKGGLKLVLPNSGSGSSSSDSSDSGNGSDSSSNNK